ncbi:hypothetical protein DTO169E5_5694 [Paecilomyces variotii]|nr:hypothetical protein DTO169E5_5694 [Paecilomyces variotii]
MSQPQRGPPGFGGGPGGQGYGGPGSVRRAREMLESGMVREARIQAVEPEGEQGNWGITRGNSKRNIVAALRGNQKPSLTISKPTPIPQWPLRDDADSQQGAANFSGSAFTSKGPPPQRPRRPSDVPSLLDSSKVQGTTPNFAYREPQAIRSPQYDSRGQELEVEPMEAYLSPPSTGKTPRVSAESDTLGALPPVGPIPDFPLPGMKLPPAPSQRLEESLSERSLRGPSFPFSTTSYISPIPEESEASTRNANSFASSMAIPPSWGSERPESDVLGVTSPASTATDSLDLRTPTSNIEGESGLVRQASIGKRGKPFLRTINRSGSGESMPQVRQTGIALGGPSVDSSPVITPGARVSYARPSPGVQIAQPDTPGDTRLDLDSSDTASSGDNRFPYSPSDADAPGVRAISPADMSSYSRSGLGVPDVSRYPSDVSGFDAPFMLDQSRRTLSASIRRPDANRDADMADMRSPGEGMSSKRPEVRRPPRLNINAVRDAEARGSLTSLPDLIRRATRVASNLERGKTASRLGIMDFLNNSQEKFDITRSPAAASDRRASEAISGILSAFPPPGITPKATPRFTEGATPNANQRSSWPLPQTMSDSRNLQTSGSDQGLTGQDSASKKRRCCGISRRVFLVISVVVFLLIAAAVVIPVVVVLTRQKDTTQPAPTVTPTTTPAPQTFECSNGGVTIHNGGNFSCVCANGFTGTHCAVAGDGSCITAAVGGSQKATLGSDLPRLLRQSESNFSIPLDSTRILSLFSSNNVSCTTENALVTFGMSSQKRRSLDSQLEESVFLRPRTNSPDSPTSDVGDIMVDPSSKPSKSETDTAATSTTSAAPGTTTLPAAQIQHILDFSRIAILYIFEMTTTIGAAIEAQEDIQAFLTGMPTSNNTMGLDGAKMAPGFVLDFEKFTITLANGTVVGGGTGTDTGGNS